ncbi:YdcF family protein [Prosthecobacter sp.]|uniref:YdcF family protein n=1 Tax=Prosthecobacter sp. TaxID=1965333 RepID=UPI003785137D
MNSFLRALADFMEPVGVLWLLLSAMLGLMLRRRQWRAAALPAAAWLLLTLTAASPLSDALMGCLESRWPPVEVEKLPECDAIVVLGGGMDPSWREPAGIHLKGGADRLFTGLLLARQHKGRVMVIGGGSFETATSSEAEADGAKRWVESWGLSPVPVESLGHCLDTHDEAVKVSAMAAKNGWKRVAVVTSAFHMTRTKAVFEKAGVSVVPVPCNYISTMMRNQKVKWLHVPNAADLASFEAWMHEVIGWWAYRLHGWI